MEPLARFHPFTRATAFSFEIEKENLLNNVTKSQLAEKMNAYFTPIMQSINESERQAREIAELLALLEGDNDSRVQTDRERLHRLQYMIGGVARLALSNVEGIDQMFTEMERLLRFDPMDTRSALQFGEMELADLLNDLGYYNEAAMLWNYFQTGEEDREAIRTLSLRLAEKQPEAEEIEKDTMNNQAPKSANEIVLTLDNKLIDIDTLLNVAEDMLANLYWNTASGPIEKVEQTVRHVQNLLIIAKERSADAALLSDEAEFATRPPRAATAATAATAAEVGQEIRALTADEAAFLASYRNCSKNGQQTLRQLALRARNGLPIEPLPA